MKILDNTGKVKQKWVWLTAALLFVASLPVISVYSSNGYQAQGIMACLSVSVLVIYALQFPSYLRRIWLWVYVICLSALYFYTARLLPNFLPRSAPTSLVLWPFVFVTIGIDAIFLRIFAKLFEN